MEPRKLVALLVFLLFSVGLSHAQVQTGKASYYAKKFEGRKTASGATYSNAKATGAHRHFPFGTKVRVTNLANNLSTLVTINDRGPFVAGRIIDVSRSAAKKLDFMGDGVTDVAIEVINDKASRKEVVQTERKETKDVAKNTPEISEKSSSATSSPKETEFYELNSNRIQPNGYGVQIGSFREAANLIRLASNLKTSYQKAVTVQIKNVQGIEIYSLVIGKFKNHRQAKRFNKKINDKYPASFIVNFANLNPENHIDATK